MISVSYIGPNGKVTKQIPSRWEEVTFKQMLDMHELRTDQAAMLAYLLGVDADYFKRAKLFNMDEVLSVISFLGSQIPDYLLTIPKTCRGYKIPPRLELETMGQLQDLRLIIQEGKGDYLATIKQYPLIVATYACVEAFGRPYDHKDADMLADYFYQAPCTEVMAIGNFTLAKLAILKSASQKASLRSRSPLSRLRRGWTSLRSRVVFMARYFTWRLRHPSRDLS